jgi:hypothetical protein
MVTTGDSQEYRLSADNLSAENAEDAEYFRVNGFVYRNHYAIMAWVFG